MHEEENRLQTACNLLPVKSLNKIHCMRTQCGQGRLAAAAHVMRERQQQSERDKYKKKKKTLTCPVAVVCQSRKVQSRDIVARLCTTKSLLDLHGRRLAEKRVKDKHQLHQSGGSALLKLSNTLPAPAPVYLQAGRRQGAALQDKPLPADWLSALLKPHPCSFEGGCG